MEINRTSLRSIVILGILCLLAGSCNKSVTKKSGKQGSESVNWQLREKVFIELVNPNLDEETGFENWRRSYFDKHELISPDYSDMDVSWKSMQDSNSFTGGSDSQSKIKTKAEYELSYMFAELQKDKRMKKILTYDREAKIISQTDYEKAVKFGYVYADNHKIGQKKHYDLKSGGIYTRVYEYDSTDMLIRVSTDFEKEPEIKTGSGRLPMDELNRMLWTWENNHRITFRYDSLGNLIEKILWYSDGSVNVKNIFRYDYKGNIVNVSSFAPKNNNVRRVTDINLKEHEIEETRFADNDSLLNWIFYFFDDKYNLIKKEVFGKRGDLLWSVSNSFDSAGYQVEGRLWWKANVKGNDSIITKRIGKKYSLEHKLIEKDDYVEEQLVNKYVLSYDDKGFVKMEQYLDGNNQLIWQNSYEYDSKGNVESITKYDNLREPVKRYEFVYEYY